MLDRDEKTSKGLDLTLEVRESKSDSALIPSTKICGNKKNDHDPHHERNTNKMLGTAEQIQEC